MRILEQYMECMKKGDNIGLADLFNEKGILHDTSFLKLNKDIMHREGKMAIAMMFHHRFGFNGGPFPITNTVHKADDNVCYFIEYGDRVVPVTAYITEIDEDGKIMRLDIFPL